MTPDAYRVALLGFSDFERLTLASCLSLSSRRTPHYTPATALDEGHLFIADGNHSASLQALRAARCLPRTLFIGLEAPPEAGAWMLRPIDPAHVLQELDRLVTQASQLSAGGLRHTALLVDDSAIALRFLQTRLEPWGIEVDLAQSSDEALPLLARQAYDWVFLDLELGPASTLDGLALCQFIKRGPGGPAPVSCQVVMVSAHHTAMDHVRGDLAGCDAYLGKPLDEAELAKLLTRQGLKRRLKVSP